MFVKHCVQGWELGIEMVFPTIFVEYILNRMSLGYKLENLQWCYYGSDGFLLLWVCGARHAMYIHHMKQCVKKTFTDCAERFDHLLSLTPQKD